MLFPKRRHYLIDVDSPEALAEALTQHTHTLCSGFRLRHPQRTLLFLNDSTCEDGAQEYAVLEEDGQQVESITFGWCSRVQALQHIEDLLAGAGVEFSHVELRLDLADEHSCGHCM